MSDEFDDFPDETLKAFEILKDPRLSNLLRGRTGEPSLHSPMKAQPAFHAFQAKGEAGQIVASHIPIYHTFRGTEFFAIDSSPQPGHGTTVVEVEFAHMLQYEGEVPTWVFSEWMPPEERTIYETAVKLIGTKFETPEIRDAAIRLRLANRVQKPWNVCNAGFPITIKVRFDEACRFEGVVWGMSL